MTDDEITQKLMRPRENFRSSAIQPASRVRVDLLTFTKLLLAGRVKEIIAKSKNG